MNRSLKLSMMVALALGSSQLLAVDLGQVQVKSALGQPLLAEIPLHPASARELKGLTVKLASSEQFARAGIVGGRTNIPLHFSVAGSAGKHPVIRITSSVPVNDPYLDLLIEVDGNEGSSVREYAILLDPPGMQAAAAAAPAAPAAPGRTLPANPATAAPAPRPLAAAPAPAASSVSNGRYGPVQSGQTLSGIARSVSPPGVDVKQMLLALQQANPDAFYRNNINALKRGAVLRVPSAAEAQAVSLAAAVAQVRRQNSDWRAGTPEAPAAVADAATRTPASGSEGATAPGHGDRLALVPAQAGADAANRSVSGQGGKSADVREELLRAKESVASLQQQGSDLKTRLQDLTDINSKNEHLLSLKDSQIAELQAKLAAARKAAGEPAQQPPATASAAAASESVAREPAPAATGSAAGTKETPVGGTTSALAESAPVAAPGSAEATQSPLPIGAASTTAAVKAPAPASTAATRPVPVKPVTAPVPAAAKPWYMQAWAWVAGAAILVLLIVLAMLGRRRRPAAAAAGASLADRFGAMPEAVDIPPEGQDIDEDQDQLLDQLAEHPDDIYLHLELVALYYARRDVERFEAAAEAMHAHITDPAQEEWQDVVHMGEDLAPEHPLFDHRQESVPAATGAGQAFDIDDYAGSSVDADEGEASHLAPPVQPEEPHEVSGYNFDFDLTRPAASEPGVRPAAVEGVDLPLADARAAPSAWGTTDAGASPVSDYAEEPIAFSDDPVDTKLDLARAYVDMGDADGARAMLGEVLKEGSQMQRDTARKLLDGLD